MTERLIRTLCKKVCCTLKDSNIAKKYWVEALETAAYVRNRIKIEDIHNGMSPFEATVDQKPDFDILKFRRHGWTPLDQILCKGIYTSRRCRFCWKFCTSGKNEFDSCPVSWIATSGCWFCILIWWHGHRIVYEATDWIHRAGKDHLAYKLKKSYMEPNKRLARGSWRYKIVG